jgi:cytochrome c peroxidase
MIEIRRRRDWMAMGAALAAAVAISGCDEMSDDKDGFSSTEWDLIKDITPFSKQMLPNPINSRADDDSLARLGQKIFFETEHAEALTATSALGMMGEVGKIGCITCHDPKKYFVESRAIPTSLGRNGPGRRNTPTMVNVGFIDWFGWAGRHDSAVMHGSGVMGTSATPLAIAHFIYRKYKDEYNAVFPNTPLPDALDVMHPEAARFPPTGQPKANAMAADGPWERMMPADQKAVQQIQFNMGRIWEAYPRKLTTPGAPFEKYANGDYAAISPGAKRGLRLFIGKAACNDCHNGPALSDNLWHNVGLAMPAGATTPDMGRYADIMTNAARNSPFNGAGEFSDDREYGRKRLDAMPMLVDTMQGAFRTPILLNIAETGPYFHTGEAKTLDEVVRHYNKGGAETPVGVKDPKLAPLSLSDTEIADLVEFMKTLTGPLPQDWIADIRQPK